VHAGHRRECNLPTNYMTRRQAMHAQNYIIHSAAMGNFTAEPVLGLLHKARWWFECDDMPIRKHIACLRRARLRPNSTRELYNKNRKSGQGIWGGVVSM